MSTYDFHPDYGTSHHIFHGVGGDVVSQTPIGTQESPDGDLARQRCLQYAADVAKSGASPRIEY